MSNASPNPTSSKRKTPPSDAELGSSLFTKVSTRQEKRKMKKINKHKPSFQFNLQGMRYGKRVTIANIRDLLLYILADGQKPSWIHIENKSFISHTVVLFVPGLLPTHIGLDPNITSSSLPFSLALGSDVSSETLTPRSSSSSKVPVMSTLFTYGCPTRAPGDKLRMHSALNQLMMCPMQESAKNLKDKQNRMSFISFEESAYTPLLFLLTPNQMVENGYNIPSYLHHGDSLVNLGLIPSNTSQCPAALLSDPVVFFAEMSAPSMPVHSNSSRQSLKGNESRDRWIETPKANVIPEDGKYTVLAIDCEMVVSAYGEELARVSVINFETGDNIYDQLVKPPVEVLDYRTPWSGITPESLRSVSQTLSSVQDHLVSGPTPLITPHTILVGHSLECDLNALRIKHPLCIDTALIYRHPRGPPFKPGLKWLAQRWLNRTIQGGQMGHDSAEDAKACVDLLKMKLNHGPDFGNAVNNMEPVIERLNRYGTELTKSGIKSAYCDYGDPRWMYGSKAATKIQCTSDDEVVEAIKNNVETHDFVFGRLMDLANQQEWYGSGTSRAPEGNSVIDGALEGLNFRITSLQASMPTHTALVIVTGHSDPRPMLELVQKRQEWEKLVKASGVEGIAAGDRWSAEDDRLLEESVEKAKEGMAFFRVTSHD